MGNRHLPMVGAYIPPSKISTLVNIDQALNRFRGYSPILMGDLNANLDQPTRARDLEIAAAVATAGLEDMLPHFRQRQPFGAGLTWGRHGENATGGNDYILGADWQMFSNVGLCLPRNFASDHQLVLGILSAPTATEHARYLRGRHKFPLQVPPELKEHSLMVDSVFEDLLATIPCPNRKERRLNL